MRLSVENADSLPASRSACALAPDDHFDRLDDDGQIEQRTMVLHIEQIVLQFLDRIVFRRSIRIAQLRPAGETRLDAVTFTIVGNSFIQSRYELRPFRPRPDETHLAAQHIENL